MVGKILKFNDCVLSSNAQQADFNVPDFKYTASGLQTHNKRISNTQQAKIQHTTSGLQTHNKRTSNTQQADFKHKQADIKHTTSGIQFWVDGFI